MKSLIVTLSLFLLSSQIDAQTREPCPDICPAVYMPVCGQTNIDGESVRCNFSNFSSCQHRINWDEVPLEKCGQPSTICSRFR